MGPDALLPAAATGPAADRRPADPAFRRAPDWPNGMRAAYGAFFNFLASRPALAYGAGPAAMEHRIEALRPLEKLIAEGFDLAPETPRLAAEGIAGGIYSLTYRKLRESGPTALPALALICAYITLSPFIGAEEACRVANGDGRGRAR